MRGQGGDLDGVVGEDRQRLEMRFQSLGALSVPDRDAGLGVGKSPYPGDRAPGDEVTCDRTFGCHQLVAVDGGEIEQLPGGRRLHEVVHGVLHPVLRKAGGCGSAPT